eukprot:scaffold306_cov525-Prasinococcus_capsulatus_cf.AAC.7
MRLCPAGAAAAGGAAERRGAQRRRAGRAAGLRRRHGGGGGACAPQTRPSPARRACPHQHRHRRVACAECVNTGVPRADAPAAAARGGGGERRTRARASCARCTGSGKACCAPASSSTRCGPARRTAGGGVALPCFLSVLLARCCALRPAGGGGDAARGAADAVDEERGHAQAGADGCAHRRAARRRGHPRLHQDHAAAPRQVAAYLASRARAWLAASLVPPAACARVARPLLCVDAWTQAPRLQRSSVSPKSCWRVARRASARGGGRVHAVQALA